MLTATSALANSPHFISADNTIDTSTGALVTSFKDAGLGTGTTSIAITLSARASATCQCYNKAGNKPQGVPSRSGRPRWPPRRPRSWCGTAPRPAA